MVNKVSNHLHIGDVIKVYRLDGDKDSKKLSLSIKKFKKDPWIGRLDKYIVDSKIKCRIVRFYNSGGFVDLEHGVDGLIHISEVSHKHIEKLSHVLKIGEDIKAKILIVNEDEKKITLSIKQVNSV